MKHSSQKTAQNKIYPAHKKCSAQRVGVFFPKITKHIFERYGFSTATLVSDWPAIVGSDLAQFTRPEKLKWPFHRQDFIPEMTDSRSGATLILRVEGARSLEIQFGSSQIIERINTYFGYKAVTDIRIMQAPLKPKPLSELFKEETEKQETKKTKQKKKISSPNLSNINNSPLRDALQRMANGLQKAATSEIR